MRKRYVQMLFSLALAAAMALPASAVEMTIDAPDPPKYGKPSSIDVVHTPDGGARKNEDISKNAALIPPAFGSPSMDCLYTGEYLTPDLAPGGRPLSGAEINGASAAVVTPGSTPSASAGGPVSSGYTSVTDDLYYQDGSLGTLSIPAIGLTVKVYEGTSSQSMKKGAAHFEDTSIWDGNVAFAAHNRGVSSYFGKIYTLDIGSKISYTTKLGTRTYEVISVEKVNEMDSSGLAPVRVDQITLYTCVRDQREARWKVVAMAV